MAAILVVILAIGNLSVPAVHGTPSLKFPWDKSENPWYLTQGPHDWTTGTQSGLDFDKDGTSRKILSMFEGDAYFVGLDTPFVCSINGQTTQNPTIKVRASDGSGLEIWYVHLNSFSISQNTHVLQGTELGYSGDKGCASGVHLHVELVINGQHSSWWGRSIDGWSVSANYQSLYSSNSLPQSNIGDIGGFVKDSTNGAGINGASVTFSAGGSTTTDSTGRYLFSGVPAGSATITASANGYASNSVSATVNAHASTQAQDIYLTPNACVAAPSRNLPLSPSSCAPFTLTSPSYNVQTNQQFNVDVRLHVNSGQFSGSNGDHLYGLDNAYGAWPVQPVVGTISAGQDFDFNFIMTAPGSNGTYTSHWQMKQGGNLVGPISTVTLNVNNVPPPPPGDGAQLCTGTNYGSPCQTFTYSSNGTCIYLGSMDRQAKSIKFIGTYSGNYDAVMYSDSACQVYNARYGQDTPDFQALDNAFSSMRLERHSWLINAECGTSGVTLYQNANYGGTCLHASGPTYVGSLRGYNFNDLTMSVRIVGNWVLYLWENDNRDGLMKQITQDVPDLTTWTFAHTASSAEVEVPGTCKRLGTSVNPSGAGNVSVNTSKNCGDGYLPGTTIPLVATANPGYSFGYWSGSLSGTSAATSFQIYTDNSIAVANFSQPCYALTLSSDSIGTISSNPTPNCNGGTQYFAGTVVQLTANPNDSSIYFQNWIGDVTGNANPVNITMDGDKSVMANFGYVSLPCYTLTINLNPSSSGSVTPNPAPNCNNGTQYTFGTYIQLTASPASGYVFLNWSGDYVGSSNPLSIQIAANKSVTANFAGNPLANSPWPMFHHDPGHTGRSQYNGPTKPILKWKYAPGVGSSSMPVIGQGGTVYVGLGNKLYAFDPNGNNKWNYSAGGNVKTPIIAADGTLYFGAEDGKLYSVNSNGTLKWTYTTGSWINDSPALAADGTIYIGSSDGFLYAINSTGSLKWSYNIGSWINPSPAVGSDGNIYLGSTTWKVYSINSSGNLNWAFATGGYVDSSPSLAPDGTIYIGSWDHNLYALNPDGSQKWKYSAGDAIGFSSPAIGIDGTVYFGSNDHQVYAVKPDGNLKWRYATGSVADSSPAIGADGTIFVGSNDNNIYAFNPDGSIKWSYSLPGSWFGWSGHGPVISSDGTIYATDTGTLYALRDTSTTTGGPIYLPFIMK